MKGGKKDFPISIGEQLYQFRYNFDALTLIEDITGRSFAQVLNESSLGIWKIVFFAGLKKNHPDIALDGVGELIDQAENLGALKLEVQAALLNSLGVDKKSEEDAPAKKKKERSATVTDA